MFARIALLALALFSLLPAPAPAQTYRFPAGDGEISGYPLVPIFWKGKLALLSIGPAPWSSPPGPHVFVRYDRQFSNPVIPPISFTLAAAYAQDTRPCAVGSIASIDNYSDMGVLVVGTIPPAGWVYWEGSVPVELNWPVWKQIAMGQQRPYAMWYCPYPSMQCGNCPKTTGGAPGPEFCAVVLTIN